MTNKTSTFGEFLVKFDGHEQRDVDRFDQTMKNVTSGFSLLSDKLDEMRRDLSMQVDDHEKRLRAIELSVTRILTWGTAALFVVSIAQFTLQYFR